MKKFALYSTAFLAMLIYGLACSETFMKYFVGDWKNENRPRFLRFDKYEYGDLYGMSYLPQFKIPTGGLYTDDRTAESNEDSINLWIIGDSFLAHAIKPEDNIKFFKNARLQDFYWGLVDKHPKKAELDKNKLNVLLIEITERLIRGNFSTRSSAAGLVGVYQTSTAQSAAKQPAEETVSWRSKIAIFSQERLVPENIDQNLELMLFGYEFFEPVKELKSEINYGLFSRVSSEVSVSRNKNNLFYGETVNPALNTSSFKPLSDDELNEIVKNINFVAEEYRKKGFDEVIFSITPNAVTIADPEMMDYNNLIPGIQNNPNLKVRVVDVYSKMKQSEQPSSFYWKNDSHWNSEGFKLWVDETNRTLESLPR